MPPWPSWTIREATEQTGYHPEYLRRLIGNGSINAEKVGTVWLIEIRSLNEYIARLDPNDARTGARTKP
jgi:excisionase family DNA binding protein